MNEAAASTVTGSIQVDALAGLGPSASKVEKLQRYFASLFDLGG